jgi:hypothetical protein
LGNAGRHIFILRSLVPQSMRQTISARGQLACHRRRLDVVTLLFQGKYMARIAVTPVVRVDRVRGATIERRTYTYLTQLEEWRIYAQKLADERRRLEPVINNHRTGET